MPLSIDKRSLLLAGAALVLAFLLATSASAGAAMTCDGKKVTIMGTPGPDHIVGKLASDVIYDGGGDDVIEGGPNGNDRALDGGPVTDHAFGGPGNDTVSYARSNAALQLELGGTGGPPGCATPDHIRADDESLEGSDGADTLIGDNADNSLLGHLGADTFIGKGGHDFIEAVDGHADAKIDCGGGEDEAVIDKGLDPKPLSC